MRSGFVLVFVAVLTWTLVDAVQLLSPAQVAADFYALSAGLSRLQTLAYVLFFLGSGALALQERGVAFLVSALCAAVWCIGWLHWVLNDAVLPAHPELVSFAAVAALCAGLLRWCRGLWRLLLLLAALLALTPFASAAMRGTGTTPPTETFFAVQLLGELVLLIALAHAMRT